MSSLSSSSTDAQVWAAYDDNAGFEENGSPSQAAAFITACVILLRRRPVQMSNDNHTVAFDGMAVREQLNRARKWLSVNKSGNGNGVRFIDFSGLRD
jgi:hypothetical protein